MLKPTNEPGRPRMRHRWAATSVAVALAMGAGSAKADPNLLSGDQATACEVILCLAATAGTPSACASPLRKYFSLNKPWKRLNFLKLCPKQSGPDIDLAAIVAAHPRGLVPDPPAPPASGPAPGPGPGPGPIVQQN